MSNKGTKNKQISPQVCQTETFTKAKEIPVWSVYGQCVRVKRSGYLVILPGNCSEYMRYLYDEALRQTVILNFLKSILSRHV